MTLLGGGRVFWCSNQLPVAKPPTSLLVRERKPVPPGTGSQTGNDSLKVACPPLSVTAGPSTGWDVLKGGKQEVCRLPVSP